MAKPSRFSPSSRDAGLWSTPYFSLPHPSPHVGGLWAGAGEQSCKATGVSPKASRRSLRENTKGLGAEGRKPGCSGIRLPGRRPVALQPTWQVMGRATYVSGDLYLSMPRCPGLCAGLLAHLRLPTPPSLHFLATVYTRDAACFFSPLGRVWSLTG